MVVWRPKTKNAFCGAMRVRSLSPMVPTPYMSGLLYVRMGVPSADPADNIHVSRKNVFFCIFLVFSFVFFVVSPSNGGLELAGLYSANIRINPEAGRRGESKTPGNPHIFQFPTLPNVNIWPPTQILLSLQMGQKELCKTNTARRNAPNFGSAHFKETVRKR